jgi:NitT/TauT family transport system substrate-binding protein
MRDRRFNQWSRREFLTKFGLASSAALLGFQSDGFPAEGQPEITSLRVAERTDATCPAPVSVAEELLHGEGFTELQYVRVVGGSGIEKALASGAAHIGMSYAVSFITRVSAGDPIVILAGGHVGCYELFANGKIRAIRELRDKAIAVNGGSSTPGALLRIMLAQVGLDPAKDVHWVIKPPAEQVKLLAEGKVDAFMAFAPAAQELRAKKIGHVIMNSAVDRPWSQYFCCVIAGNREFVRKNPVAAKRAVRALLKANDLCAREPERAARLLVDRGLPTGLDYARQMLRDLPYGRWRDYDAEDTVRFYALRLNEVGMITSSPQKIIAQGTDWRFLRELKKELKA